MIGQFLAHYEVTGLLGKGGMGEVYRARDTKLDREVALKLLPLDLATDPERLARFQREAKVLASLNHANIAGLHGLEEADGKNFLVMELVEGENLAQRLQRGAFAVDEAIDVAKQIAQGLEEAHDKGIVHRDLKPANIQLTPEGQVKILDFGLARAYSGDSEDEGDLATSPTITAAMTQAGTILGTAAYMSPEQARGKTVDVRADLWAFGVILWEMLAGRQLFEGETVSDTLASVLKNTPEEDALPKDTPSNVRRILRRCLQRDPRRRLRSAGDALIELEDTTEADATTRTETSGRGSTRLAWGLVALLAIALVGTQFVGGRRGQEDAHALNLELQLPSDQRIADSTRPALSPDGRWLAYATQDLAGNRSVWLRSLESFESELIEEASGTDNFFWSPDSRELGLLGGGTIARLDILSRGIQEICECINTSRGASWSKQGTILFALSANSGIYSLPVAGGEPQEVTRLPEDSADLSHRWPKWLPDGERFLFTAWSNALQEQQELGGIFLATLDGAPPRRLLPDSSEAILDPSGRILFHRNGKLMSVGFNVERGELSGTPVVVDSEISFEQNNGRVYASSSNTGELVYSIAQRDPDTELGWIEMPGGEFTPLGVSEPTYGLALSPTLTHYAVERLVQDTSVEIWIGDLQRQTLSRLTRFDSDSWGAIFSPNGRNIIYTNQDRGVETVYLQDIDGATPPEMLMELKSVVAKVSFWSEDGEFLLLDLVPRDQRAREIHVFDFQSREVRPLLADEFHQRAAVLSPDGRWLAYESEESGRSEVYLRPYPALDRKWQISRDGGFSPRWNDDGRRLVYSAGDRMIMGVDLEFEGDDPKISVPENFFQVPPGLTFALPTPAQDRLFGGQMPEWESAPPLRFVVNQGAR